MDGWTIDAESYEEGRRYELPEEAVDGTPDAASEGYLLLRPLTDAEALQRESLGIEEWYYLDGQEPTVRRTYNLQRMAEYDYRHCIVDFSLPVRRRDDVEMAPMPDDPEEAIELLGLMPPRLAEWVAECLADVNMRSLQQRRIMASAKKN